MFLSDLLVVTTADEAYHAIREGFSVRLPSNAWTEAREVLRRLGCSTEKIDSLFEFARGDSGS